MREQLLHLEELAQKPHVVIQVVPFEAVEQPVSCHLGLTGLDEDAGPPAPWCGRALCLLASSARRGRWPRHRSRWPTGSRARPWSGADVGR
ncbi:MAG TPA: Scr1 family TA system antitoxin-like transcriptional regulator [Trebonia sp.]